MSSKIEITKVCLLCGKAFIARKTTTSYCSAICAKRAYKERVRCKKVESVKNEVSDKLYSSRAPTPTSDEFLTPTKTTCLLGIGRATLYRYLADNIIKCITMKGKTLIRRSDINALFDNAPKYEKKRGLNTNQAPITDFYTMEEIKAKYSVKESWVFKTVKQKRISRTTQNGKGYYSSKHIDAAFADKVADPKIKEWYSVDDIRNRYNMMASTLYCFVSDHNIRKHKKGREVFYSKYHFDLAKEAKQPIVSEWYSAEEAMIKYNLTRDQIYHYVKYHIIPKVKDGRYIKITKSHLDNIFEKPIIL